MKIGKTNRRVIISVGVTGSALVLLSVLMLRLELTIRGEGTVVPRTERTFYTPEDAMVSRIGVEPGDRVEAGDLLIELVQPDLSSAFTDISIEKLETAFSLAQAKLARKEWALRPAELELVVAPERAALDEAITVARREIADIYEDIREQDLISALEMNLRKIERLQAESDWLDSAALAAWHDAGVQDLEGKRLGRQVEMLAARLHHLNEKQERITERIGRLTLRAPVGGVITALDVRREGVWVARGEELARLADPTEGYLVRAYAPPRNIDLIAPDTPARMSSGVFDSIMEGYVYGRVKHVVPDAVLRAGSPHYEMEILVEETPYPLMLGSPVTVRLMLGRRSLFHMFFRPASVERRLLEGDGDR